MKAYEILAVGTGIAAMAALENAREILGPGPSFAMIGAEDRIPYKRTKIDKHLAPGFGTDDFALRDRAWYGDNGIDLILDSRVSTIDRGARRVTTVDGRTFGYGQLLLATGAEPRRLALGKHGGEELYVRSAADAEAVHELLKSAQTVAVVGGGVQGIEMAAQAATMGKDTHLFMRRRFPMESRLPEALARRLADAAREGGVDLHPGQAFDPALGADLVLISVGVEPASALARAAGLPTARGILVDTGFRTADEYVFAAGDCAELPGGYLPELWHAAEDGGRAAGRAMAGADPGFSAVPYRLKCEVFGDYYFSMAAGGGGAKVQRGGKVERHWFLDGDRVGGVAMAGDKDRAKTYERAVREGWVLSRIAVDLSLPE